MKKTPHHQRGRIYFVLAFIAALSCTVLAPRAPAQTAEELVAQVLAARGGVDKIKAIQRQRVTGKISFGPDKEGLFAVEFERPLKMHMEIHIFERTILRVYDGKSAGWVIVPPPLGPDGDVHAMEAEDLRDIADEADFDGPLVDYQSKGNQIELAGKDELSGKAVLKLNLTSKNGDVRTYYFDAATYLPLKWEGKRKAENQEIPVETFFSDYRDLNGVKFAFEIDTDSPGSAQKQQIAIEKIEIDPQLDEGHFAKPTPPPAPATPASELHSVDPLIAS